jgi:hypothetical protein
MVLSSDSLINDQTLPFKPCTELSHFERRSVREHRTCAAMVDTVGKSSHSVGVAWVDNMHVLHSCCDYELTFWANGLNTFDGPTHLPSAVNLRCVRSKLPKDRIYRGRQAKEALIDCQAVLEVAIGMAVDETACEASQTPKGRQGNALPERVQFGISQHLRVGP